MQACKFLVHAQFFVLCFAAEWKIEESECELTSMNGLMSAELKFQLQHKIRARHETKLNIANTNK